MWIFGIHKILVLSGPLPCFRIPLNSEFAFLFKHVLLSTKSDKSVFNLEHIILKFAKYAWFLHMISVYLQGSVFCLKKCYCPKYKNIFSLNSLYTWFQFIPSSLYTGFLLISRTQLTQGSMCFNTIHVHQLLLIRENQILEIWNSFSW